MYQEFTGIRSDQLATNLSGKFSINIYTDGSRPCPNCNRFYRDYVVRRAKEAKRPAAKKGQVTYKKITLDQPQFKSKNRANNEYIKIMAAKKRLSSAPRVAIRCVEQCQGNPAHGGGRASSRQRIYNCIKTSKLMKSPPSLGNGQRLLLFFYATSDGIKRDWSRQYLVQKIKDDGEAANHGHDPETLTKRDGVYDNDAIDDSLDVALDRETYHHS